jgi:hypothetical protein
MKPGRVPLPMGDLAMTPEENNRQHTELIRKICLYEIGMAQAIADARKNDAPGTIHENTPWGAAMLITHAPGGPRQRVEEQYPYQ